MKYLFAIIIACSLASDQSLQSIINANNMISSSSPVFVAASGGGTGVAGSTATVTSAMTISPVAGHTVISIVETGGTISAFACKDQNNNTLAGTSFTVITNITSTISGITGTAISGATSYTCSWTTTRPWAACTVEYSGNSTVGTPTNNTGTGSASPGTVSPVSTVTNDMMVAGIGRNGGVVAWGASTGNIRCSNVNANGSLAIVDNTSGGSSGSGVTEAATMTTATNWAASALELKP